MDKHEKTASSANDGGGDLTAVIREGDLIAVQGTRNRRHRASKSMTPKQHPPRVATTSERAKTDTNNVEYQTTQEQLNDNEKTSVTPTAVTTARTHETPTDRKTILKKEKSIESVTSSTTFHTPKDSVTSTYVVENHDVKPHKTTAVDENGPLLELWPSTIIPDSKECDEQDSDVDAKPTTSATVDKINLENEQIDLDKPCETHDGLILLVENNIKLKLVVDSKSVIEKQSIEPDDTNDLPVIRGDEDPADTECTETDKKPEGIFMSLLPTKKKTA